MIFKDLQKLKNRVAARKGIYDANWQAKHRQYSEHFMPDRGRFDGADTKNRPKEITNPLGDYTGSVAARRYASSLFSGLTPPTREWKKLTTKNREIRELGAVKADLEARNKIMDNVLSESNFYNIVADSFEEDVCFGYSAIFVDRDFEDIVRFHTFTAGTYYVAENAKGVVDTFYRRYSDTVDNIVDKFGIDNVSKKVRDKYNKGDKGHEFIDIVHAIEPNRKRDRTVKDNLNMPYRSVYYEEGADQQGLVLRISGYEKFPVIVSRIQKTANDVYGWSPCAQVLGLSKALNAMLDHLWSASESTANPTLLMSTALEGADISAGSIIPYDATLGDSAIRNAYQVDYDIQGNLLASEQLRDLIRNILNQDVFQSILSLDRSNMTATEISARVAQAAEMLVKIVTRMINEKLQPLLELVYDFIDESGRFPNPPPESDGADLEIIFTSSLALAQQQVGISAIEQFIDFISRVITVKPEAIDKFNADQSIDEYLERVGAPVKLANTDEEVANIRAFRAAQEEQERTAQMLSMTADGTQKLGNTPLGTGSALDATMEAIQNVQ